MSKSDSPNIQNIKSPRKKRGITTGRLTELKEWLDAMPDSDLMEWERLPDIGLYMDQVLTMMDRQLAFYRRGSDDRLLTHAMINNYTKDGVLPRAQDKKYTQGHLALLSILCSLKPVLSISDLSVLLENSRDGSDEEPLYQYFLKAQEDAIGGGREEVLATIEKMNDSASSTLSEKDADRRDLAKTALRLSVDARVRVMMAQKIIDLLES